MMGGLVACASGCSTDRDVTRARREVVEALRSGLGGARADVAVIFGTLGHAEALEEVSAALLDEGIARHALGCTCEGVIADGREIVDGPGLSVWAGKWAGGEVVVRPIQLRWEEGELVGWPGASATPGDAGMTLLLGDPYTFPADRALKVMEADAPGWPVFGGMASAGHEPGRNRLTLDGQEFDEGAVAVAISGPLGLVPVVSQGCRPVGPAMLVTKADGNVISALGRRPALEVAREVLEALPEEDRAAVRGGLLIGTAINEYQETFERGDFLVRAVMGVAPQDGLAIGDAIRVGRTVRFQVRDALTADEDLDALLDPIAREEIPIAGALLFSCNGRGQRLFPGPDHDAQAVRSKLGPIPVAGFFAMGEIGPIGRRNFVHGFTAAIAAFRSASETTS